MPPPTRKTQGPEGRPRRFAASMRLLYSKQRSPGAGTDSEVCPGARYRKSHPAMAAASDQQGLETLSGRKFSFYPAIRNIERNEWTFERATWSEALVVNARGGQEVWIPRNYIGSVSSADEPVLIVGLNRELEFKAGAVWPHRKTVIEMPAPRATPPSDRRKEPSAPAGGVPATSEAEYRVSRFVGGALAIALAACLMLVVAVSDGFPNPLEWFWQVSTETADQRYLGLNSADGYHDTVIKVGKPEQEQWLTTEEAQVQFQLLWYPGRSYAVVMLGSTRGDTRYIGTIHTPSRRLLDSVRLSGGGSTASMLRNLPEF